MPPPIPNYYTVLRLDRKEPLSDELIEEAFLREVKRVRNDLDLDLDTAKDDEDKLRLAFEMVQCASSRKHVDNTLKHSKLLGRAPNPRPLTWNQALLDDPLSFAHRLGAQQSNVWTQDQEEEHAKFMENGGHLFKDRHITSEEQFVTLLRYNCSFNAFSILGLARVTLVHEEIHKAVEATALPAWKESVLGPHITDDMTKKYETMVHYAKLFLLAPRAEEYVKWLVQGYVDVVRNGVILHKPVTRTNIAQALGIPMDNTKKRKLAHSLPSSRPLKI